MTQDRRKLGALTAAAGLGAMELLMANERQRGMTYTLRDEHLWDDTYEKLQTLWRVLDTREADRRRKSKGIASPVPTTKRAKVKAARKANRRRVK